jgi:hypothetical protein
MISYIAAKSYDMKDLAVLSSKAVTTSIEGIASCLGSSTVDLTFPLNAAEGPQLASTLVARYQVVFKDGIQLPYSPFEALLGGYTQLLPKVFTDPRCQFGRQPAQNRVDSAERIIQPRWLMHIIIIAQNIWFSWKYIHAGRLEKKHVQALLACKMMVCIAVPYSSISFSALNLNSYVILVMISCSKQ